MPVVGQVRNRDGSPVYACTKDALRMWNGFCGPAQGRVKLEVVRYERLSKNGELRAGQLAWNHDLCSGGAQTTAVVQRACAGSDKIFAANKAARGKSAALARYSGAVLAGVEIHAMFAHATVIAEANERGPNLRADPRGVTQRPALRLAYEADVKSIGETSRGWATAGATQEEIAREAWADRRAIGIEYKAQTPPEALAKYTARNLNTYQDPLGPTIDYLRNIKGYSWAEIIQSAQIPGGHDLGF